MIENYNQGRLRSRERWEMRLARQIEIRSCRAWLRKSTLSQLMVEMTKGSLIDNSHSWEKDGPERNKTTNRETNQEATIMVHVKSDRGLPQSSGSQDGEEMRDLTVLTAWNAFSYSFITQLVPCILQISVSLSCLPYPQTRARPPTVPQRSSSYLHSIFFPVIILGSFLRLFD